MEASRFGTLPTRVAVAVVAIPVIVWAAMTGSYFFFALVVLLSSFALYELYLLAEKKGAFPLKTVGLVAGFVVDVAFIYERLQAEVFRFFAARGFPLSMFSQLQFLLVTILVFLLVVLLVELFRQRGSPILNAGTTVLGVMVVSLFFGTLIEIRELFPYGFPVSKFFSVAVAGDAEMAVITRWGGYTIVSLLASIWVCDTAAYFGGLTFGRHRLFERVSPKKSWEGAIFGFFGALLAMIAARSLVLDYLRLQDAVIIGAIVGVFGQIGDLVESRFKRDAGVKDSSALIPGHGGVYDRFDSLVFVAPIVYLYIDFVVLS
ncbi:MAG TPA: phosphatidate cytidylyltransferase [Bacteroidota bacterium]|nr:phosphatidate cytidylyltransferase [Bacteroidota bacterium]